MNPELKFHSIIVSATTLIVFTIWTKFTSLIVTYQILSVLAAALISLGLYRTINMLLLSVFRNIKPFKKFILGASYMEGTWIGFFVGHDNKIRYIVETFEQDINKLNIRGTIYKEDGTFHGSYNTKDVSFDLEEGTLSYSYDADCINNMHINPGFARFNIERTAKENPPKKLKGYSSDLFSSKKLMAFEEKITEETTIDTKESYENAKEIFKKYENFTGVID